MVDHGPAYENDHVHTVYEQIASHFSSTRYKPWPIVERYLRALPAGSIGLDIGCGNGKYLSVNPALYIVASDRSTNLAQIATTRQPPHGSVVVADTLALPHPLARFDFAICIAVLHHLSTAARRVAGLREILAHLRADEGCTALVYVWALEQKNSRRGWDEGGEQDVMVPWVMQGGNKPKAKAKNANQRDAVDDEAQDQPPEEPKTFHRYYHLYRKGELEADVAAAGGEVVESGYEKDNWWAVMRRKE
ncbi:S-adenosyl-L-methionine-dependent methyltransferase [Phyllosticta citribraziliensis]|uniref:S-adenosyl-L-methionine-dependent methyltransferase n=1 Tax=Phyllosticta citribraziliensis TaxID=989973 RepID=A0ABR1LXE3_9PEZI